nr:MAG TPA: hypothetical protein [Crassvirales sp.]
MRLYQKSFQTSYQHLGPIGQHSLLFESIQF